jgi:AcrR family transcriptional regulator
MPRPRADRPTRRAELAAVAARVFGERGVAATSVSDIVREAGVAQGTFYLYFDSKEDALLTVVEQIGDHLIASIEAGVATRDDAAGKLLSLRDALISADADPAAAKIADFMHRPENRSLHDRLEEHLTSRLISVVEAIVSQGVAEKVFDVPDVRSAAWFVLGGLRSAELSGASAEEMPEAIRTVTELAMRALGYRGERP